MHQWMTRRRILLCNWTSQVGGWYSLGKNKKEKLGKIRNDDLDKEKGKILIRLWKEKEKRYKEDEVMGRKRRGGYDMKYQTIVRSTKYSME